MKKIFSLVLILCMLLPICALAEETAWNSPLPEGAVRELSIDRNGGSAPLEDHYIYEEGNSNPVGYEDASIRVVLQSGRYEETDYWAARIKIAGSSQLRTEFSNSYNSKSTDFVTTMGRRVSAVLALTGDSFINDKFVKTLVIRQGIVYRNKLAGLYDVLLIDDQGEMHILPMAQKEDVENFDGTIISGFTFGPALVIDGEPRADYLTEISGTSEGKDYTKQVAAFDVAQRLVFAQTGPLEYLVIATAGPENTGNTGLTLIQMIEMMQQLFPDVQNAYNLDGGTSACMVFRTAESAYGKINVPDGKMRSISDMIYFASALDAE